MSDSNTLLTKGVEEVIVKEHLEQALQSGKKLRVKFGIDPTAPDLHLGHTVALRKLREFQDAGHVAVLIIGDYTAMIGDPSGRSEARKPLTKEQVEVNMKEYLKQAAKVIDGLKDGRADKKKLEVYNNSEWHSKSQTQSKQSQFEVYIGSGAPVMSVASGTAVAHILKRDDFEKRLDEGKEITVLEILYPLLQGYDSVAVRADVEIGGTDQKFNLLEGRRVQRQYNMPEQDIMTLPLLEGTDGAHKMSKSFGNYIALDAEPNDMFGKIMSIPDALLSKYFMLLTSVEYPTNLPPRDAKLLLAKTIIGMYHGEKAAMKAEEEFVRVFSKKEAPSDAPTVSASGKKVTLLELLQVAEPKESKSELRRLIEQGAVKINDEAKKNPNEVCGLRGGEILKIGKKKFFKIT